MPQPNKILNYGLEERVLELSALPGMTDLKIADVINQELQDAGKNGTVSASSVSRFRRGMRAERSAETKALIQDHIKAMVPKDLEALEEIEGVLLTVFRDPAQNLRTRQSAAMNAVKIIETKLKYSGALDDPNKAEAAIKKAQDLLEGLDEELKGKAERAFGIGRQKEGVPGSH